MGVINVTPDSFSDGGQYTSPGDAADAALRMVDAGASIVDIGGESTRPGAIATDSQEQLDRVMPVIEAIRRDSDTVVSIDTGNPVVMQEATSVGAEIINDVFALTQPGALAAAAATNAAICLVHMQGVPATMQHDPHYDDLPGELIQFLGKRIQDCADAGIGANRLLVDPGFGFGKTDRQNLVLLGTLRQIAGLGPPVLVGLSRKGTLGKLVARPPGERLSASLAAAVIAVERGARIVRTHDVRETVDALKIVQAVKEAGHA
jgi:dihydropteroate synthase